MPQVYPLPASSATGFKRVAPLASCAALEPRPTHHPPLVSSSPSVRSGICRDCAAGTHPSRPERPALTLTLIAFGRRCEQDKLIVKLAEPKLFVTITNVTTSSGAIVSVSIVLSSPGPAPVQWGIASRTCRRARPCAKATQPHLPPLG